MDKIQTAIGTQMINIILNSVGKEITTIVTKECSDEQERP